MINTTARAPRISTSTLCVLAPSLGSASCFFLTVRPSLLPSGFLVVLGRQHNCFPRPVPPFPASSIGGEAAHLRFQIRERVWGREGEMATAPWCCSRDHLRCGSSVATEVCRDKSLDSPMAIARVRDCARLQQRSSTPQGPCSAAPLLCQAGRSHGAPRPRKAPAMKKTSRATTA